MFPPTPNTRPARPSWREAVRRSADLAVAFLTLESYDLSGPRGPVSDPAPHPHRKPLRASTRRSRPGAIAPRVQHCVTPLEARQRRATKQHTLH
jgi:hypothetical protein